MATGKFIAYYRVSTQKQGQSGLGLEAQQQAVMSYLNGGQWDLAQEFTEVETGKGSDAMNKRPQLKAAIDAAKKQKATLIIAKLDRLARNVHFVSGLMESKVRFVACDMPEANELTIHIMAAFAEHEAKRISQRTKDALAIAKTRGVVLGAAGAANLKPNIEQRQQAADEFANKLKGIIEGMKGLGLSQRAMCDELNQLGIKTARGGAWSLVQLQRVRARIES
ncbi:recombinase family protein [Methylomonas sp. LL1]|uniref:recombinase family protein n=1 Tax=Methylomonas sp. LL1 TaxID=2785785 RepID=UPI0018C36FA0|nr:recombinase family protein [Methylomonas sp. LL1]QPK64007.1 recombinase family protein [Methylomonas sp. LL1]